MKIHRIETGKVRIKSKQIARKNGHRFKLARLLLDHKWSEWLPIYAWAIEHPEGVIIVDTGQTSRTGHKGYLPKWHPYYAFAVDFDVKPKEEIGAQLSAVGIDQYRDVSKVILTHLHSDHAGGLYHFPGAEIIIHNKEYNSAIGLSGIGTGYLPHRWPSWLRPTFIEFGKSGYGPFPDSFSVTRDRKVIVVYTPGHSPGHISVIVEMGEFYYFLAGDASYNEPNMINGIADGIGDKKKSIETLKKIRLFTQLHPTVYLPAHDPDVPRRMDHKIITPNYLSHLEYLTRSDSRIPYCLNVENNHRRAINSTTAGPFATQLSLIKAT